MDRATLNDFLSEIPDRLRFPIRIGGIPVGYIDLDRELIKGAAHVRAHKRDKGQMMMAAVVYQEAVANWQRGMLDAADDALVMVVRSFGETPTALEVVLERLVDDAINPLLKKHRYCAICGRLVRRSRTAKTCGDPECKKRLRWGKEKMRARTRDNVAAMRQSRDRKKVDTLARALQKTGSPAIPNLGLTDAKAIATAMLHSPTTIVQGIHEWLKSTRDPQVQKAAADLLRYRRETESRRKKR